MSKALHAPGLFILRNANFDHWHSKCGPRSNVHDKINFRKWRRLGIYSAMWQCCNILITFYKSHQSVCNELKNNFKQSFTTFKKNPTQIRQNNLDKNHFTNYLYPIQRKGFKNKKLSPATCWNSSPPKGLLTVLP